MLYVCPCTCCCTGFDNSVQPQIDNTTGMGHAKRWHGTPRTSSSRMTSLHPCTNSWKKPMVRACLFVLARHQLFRLNYLFHNELPDLFEVFELPRCCMFSRLLRHISVLLPRSQSCRHCFAGAGFCPPACSCISSARFLVSVPHHLRI